MGDIVTNNTENVAVCHNVNVREDEVDLMPQEPPIVMYCMKQINFLTQEIDRLEDELAKERASHSREIKRVWQKVQRSVQVDEAETESAHCINGTNREKEKLETDSSQAIMSNYADNNSNDHNIITSYSVNNITEDVEKRKNSDNIMQGTMEETLPNNTLQEEQHNCSLLDKCNKEANDNTAKEQTEVSQDVNSKELVTKFESQEKKCEEKSEERESLQKPEEERELLESYKQEEHKNSVTLAKSNTASQNSSSLLSHDLTKSESDVECNSTVIEDDGEENELQREGKLEENSLRMVEQQNTKVYSTSNTNNRNDHGKLQSLQEQHEQEEEHLTNNSSGDDDDQSVIGSCELIDVAVQTDDEFYSLYYYYNNNNNNNNNDDNINDHVFTKAERLRMKLSEVCAAHRKAVETVKQLTHRLQEEYNQRETLMLDKKCLTSEIESLRQRVVEEINVQASLQSTLNEVQVAHEQMCSTVEILESDKEELQRRLKLHDNNLEHLSEERAYMQHELECLVRDNEQINVALRSGNARISQLNEELLSKEAELHETMHLYHTCLRESEIAASANAQLLMQLDNLKGQLAYHGQQIICHEEEQTIMQSKEMQLASDVQLLTFDIEQLHRQLKDREEYVTQLEQKCHELEETNNAKDYQVRMMDKSCAKIHKQLLLYEEELQCSRNDKVEFEQRVQEWQERAKLAENKWSMLETKHAQLLTEHVLLTSSNMPQLQQTVEQHKQEIEKLKTMLDEQECELEHRKQLCNEVENKMNALQQELTDVVEAKKRLQKIVMEQANTLNELSREETKL